MNSSENVPDQAFLNLRTRNATAFTLLFDIEVLLREFVAARLEQEYGNKWIKQGLPPDIQTKVKDGIAYERSIAWHKGVLHHALYYIDFPDLKKLIIVGSNWNKVFSDVFWHKTGTETSISDLELLRNKVAHNRFVTDSDLKIIEAVHTKLFAAISSNELQIAKRSAVARVPIFQLLREIRDAIRHAEGKLADGKPLSAEELSALSNVNSWWFDEAYLGKSTAEFEHFASLCRDYAQIPSGVGQAYARREWAANALALDKARNALSSIEQLISLGDKHVDTTS